MQQCHHPGQISVPTGFKGPISWRTSAGVSDQAIMQDNKRLKQDSTNLRGQLATLHEELRMSQQLQGQHLTKLNVLAGKYKELQHEHQQLQLHCQQLQQQCQQLHMQLQQRQQPQFQHKRHYQRKH
jgi:chromosome segregation ATPase